MKKYGVFIVLFFLVSCTETYKEVKETIVGVIDRDSLKSVMIPDFSQLKPSELLALHDRGKYLVSSVAACGACHARDPMNPNSPLAGGRKYLRDGTGEARMPNLTLGGLGDDWSLPELMAVMKSGKSLDGRELSSPVHKVYRWMSDADLRAISLYLRSLKPVSSSKNIEILDTTHLSREELGDLFNGYVPEFPISATAGYGRYLAHYVSACVACHTEEDEIFSEDMTFAGNEFLMLGERQISAPDIRPRGQGLAAGWTEERFFDYLSSQNGDKDHNCPRPFYKTMKEGDRRAIARYLKFQ